MAIMVSDRAAALHRDAMVCDMTLPFQPGLVDWSILPRMTAVGIDFASLTVNDTIGTLAGTIHNLAQVRAGIEARSGELAFVESVAGIQTARAAGKLGVTFHLQETNPLEGAIEHLRTYRSLGVRHMLLIGDNKKNRVGDGCAEPTDAGLSLFGRRVVAEMNRLGILIDGSHGGHRTTMEAMQLTNAPFIFSHSNAHSLVPHYRNVRDDQIKACARTGGLVGICGLGTYLGDLEAGTEAMFRHLDYMVSLVGPAHVGIGLDYMTNLDWMREWLETDPDAWPSVGGSPALAPAFAAPEQLPELTQLMVARGYPEPNIRAILGGNFLRVAEEVWGG